LVRDKEPTITAPEPYSIQIQKIGQQIQKQYRHKLGGMALKTSVPMPFFLNSRHGQLRVDINLLSAMKVAIRRLFFDAF